MLSLHLVVCVVICHWEVGMLFMISTQRDIRGHFVLGSQFVFALWATLYCLALLIRRAWKMLCHRDTQITKALSGTALSFAAKSISVCRLSAARSLCSAVTFFLLLTRQSHLWSSHIFNYMVELISCWNKHTTLWAPLRSHRPSVKMFTMMSYKLWTLKRKSCNVSFLHCILTMTWMLSIQQWAPYFSRESIALFLISSKLSSH